eukprot:jgi/Mesen1/2426/ME000157S01562
MDPSTRKREQGGRHTAGRPKTPSRGALCLWTSKRAPVPTRRRGGARPSKSCSEMPCDYQNNKYKVALVPSGSRSLFGARPMALTCC